MPALPSKGTREQLAVSSAPRRGILLILLSGVVFTANDTMMKWLRADFPVGEIICVRGFFAVIVLAIMVRFMGGWHTLRVRDWPTQWLRAGLVIATTMCFLAAIRYMPLADAIGIAFAGPLFTVALAGPLLGERIGWRRWTAVSIGFVGVLLMVRPSGDGFQLAAILPLVTALCGSLRDIVTRRMSLTDHSNATLMFSLVVTVAVGALSLPLAIFFPSQAWVPLNSTHVLMLIGSGFLVGIGQYCVIESLRVAEVGLVAPFKYASYVWALLFGFFIWGHLPTSSSIVGVLAVIGSGLFIFWREQRLAEQR